MLAAPGNRANIRLMVFAGKVAQPGATPNCRKKPKTIRSPLIEQIEQIDAAAAIVLRELEAPR